MKTKIMVFGTFDLLHKGHEHFFKQARSLAKNPYLIVSVARDKNVKKIKGFNPHFSEQQRLQQVLSCKLVDKAILGADRNYIAHIAKEKPQILALGYDQVAYTNQLSEKLEKAGLKTNIVRLKAHKPHVYKSSLLKKKFA